VNEIVSANTRILTMTPRIDYKTAAPDALKAMFELEGHVRRSGLDTSLLNLVKLRASFMNGCAYCVDMHSKEARVAGETEQRIYAVPVWHETPFFTPRERATLAWTEALTDIARTGAPDDVYTTAREHFTEAELVNLTLAIVAINGWNRFAIGFRVEPGTYQPSRVGNHPVSHPASPPLATTGG